jgi:hypothetical protein
MTENAQNPAAQNPGNAETFWDYESTWKGFNQISYIIQNLPMSTYEQAAQDHLNGIQDPYCLDTLEVDYIHKLGQLSPSDAAKLIAPLAEQMAAAPVHTYPTIFETGNNVLECCKNIESLSENAQVSAAQNPAENPSKAVDSDPNLQSYFDAWNGIQYINYLMCVPPEERTWSDAIQHELDGISNNCTHGGLIFWQLVEGFTPSDAAKRIASIAKPLLALYTDATGGSYPGYLQDQLEAIIDECKAIDPSSVS